MTIIIYSPADLQRPRLIVDVGRARAGPRVVGGTPPGRAPTLRLRHAARRRRPQRRRHQGEAPGPPDP